MVKKQTSYPSVFLLCCPKCYTIFQKGRKLNWKSYLYNLKDLIEQVENLQFFHFPSIVTKKRELTEEDASKLLDESEDKCRDR